MCQLIRFITKHSAYALIGKFKDQPSKLGIRLPACDEATLTRILLRTTVSKHNPAPPRHYQREQS